MADVHDAVAPRAATAHGGRPGASQTSARCKSKTVPDADSGCSSSETPKGLGFEIAVDGGFDISSATWRSVNIGGLQGRRERRQTPTVGAHTASPLFKEPDVVE
jgi:hypothetical protein